MFSKQKKLEENTCQNNASLRQLEKTLSLQTVERKKLPQQNCDTFKEGKNQKQKSGDASTSRSNSKTRKYLYGNVGEFLKHNDWKKDYPRQTGRPSASSSGENRQSGKKFTNMDKNKGTQEINVRKKENVNFLNKARKKKEFDVPQRLDWMIEFSEKDGLDIVNKLANTRSGFKNLIKDSTLLKEKPDIIVLIMKMLHKVGEVEFKVVKTDILRKACNQNFLEQLESFIMNLPRNKYKNESFNVRDFLINVLKFSESIILISISERLKIPESLHKIIAKTKMIINVEEYVTIHDEVNELLQKLDKLLAKSTEENKEKKVKLTNNAELVSLATTSDYFRDINLVPTADEIFTKEEIFVRPNLICGAYNSVEHYLDVHFRLLREDFLIPMREGITEFVEKIEKQKIRINKVIKNFRFYPNVVFLYPKVVKNRIGIVINFDPKKKFKKMNWRISKMFMHGSLLCFTQDNFRTFFFGTIVGRDEKDLRNGMLVVELKAGSQVRYDLYNKQYDMAESKVYFEPYYQVLKALRTMSVYDFPMRRYVVEAQSEGHAPTYLLTVPPTQYIIESGLTDIKFPLLSPELWPSAKQLGLDDSQYEAFKFAVTREFVIIQGPPGTGKTFLGLKVAGVLLKNENIWNTDMTPIMVVCFTNHALDQFMEGLLKYTNKIVRAGGGSKSENLSIYNLRNLRKVWRQKRSLLKDLEQSNYKDMKRAAETIKMIQLNLEEINKKKGIISLELLHKQQVIDDHCYDIFKDNVLDYVEWLLPQNENVNLMENDEGNMGIIEDVDRRNFNRELLKNYVRSRSTYAISINSLNFLQKLLESEIIKLKNNDHLDQNCKLIQLCQQLRDIVYKRDCLLQRSKEIDIEDVSEIKRVRAIPVKNLNLQERWMLYRYWISKLKDSFIRDLEILGESFKECARKYDETSLRIDFEIMRNASVVGMTTTYAAKSKSLLEALKPKIVFVEEAAEVLESHIIVSVTKHCQHLILAGDHQQLRPSTSVYKLAKDYKLDISLFERMLNNGMHCEVLKVQHRMRPEIASLISPSIYPELHNHQDVKHYKKILGVKKSLFFIDHTHPDEQVGDSFSKKNEHEGQFLIALCRHLIMQGYETNAITILATYTAQMLYLKNLSKQYKLLQNVHITVVDNFQGEESDIVLLSLVRSNEKGIIGFLKIENRVCVALSRAKKGMYIMGNMKNLTQSSDIWPKINETLQQQESIGKELELQCQIHPTEKRLVSCAKDFLDLPEGGCKLICDSLLACGHNCKKLCHPRDRDHKNYKCPVNPCDKVICILGHRCKKICYEKCGPCLVLVKRKLPCGHEIDLHCHENYMTYKCTVIVKKEIPDCKHENEMQCSMDPSEFPCSVPCTFRLDCGHTCKLTCHVNKDPDHVDYKCKEACLRTKLQCSKNHHCNKKCYEKCALCKIYVMKKSPACGHKNKMQCHRDPVKFKCFKKCGRTMTCGHKCKKKCFETCNSCNVLVEKIIPDCGHKIKLQCSFLLERRMCTKSCERILSCGHKCKLECGRICDELCEEVVEGPKVVEC